MNSFLFYPLVIAIIFAVTISTLYLLSILTGNPVPSFFGRLIASWLALFLCAAYGTVASATLNVLGYGGLGQWTTARAFKYTMLALTGVWFKIEDPHDYLGKTRPAVLVGNHQTELDVAMLGHVFPRYCSVTSKKSLKYVPFLGWFMALSKTVFIERASRTQAVAAFAKAAEQMHSHKQSVFIFPEGTRSYYSRPDLLPFKKGPFHLAIQAQVPIIPVVAANYSYVLDTKRMVFVPGTIPVKVVEPIETKGKTKDDVDALLQETREKMLQALKEISAKAQTDGYAKKGQ